MVSAAPFALVAAMVAATLCGCQPLSLQPGAAAKNGASREHAVQQDDDTLAGRLDTGTKKMTAAMAQPFQTRPGQAQAKTRANRKQIAAKRKSQERSGLMAWLFPEPKQPQTMKEWLAQDRVGP